jgi:hypothetical protein
MLMPILFFKALKVNTKALTLIKSLSKGRDRSKNIKRRKKVQLEKRFAN